MSGTREDVVVRISASDLIGFLVLDPENHELYGRQQPYQSIARVAPKMDHEIGVRIPRRLHWYLSFENGTKHPVDVEFEVLDYGPG